MFGSFALDALEPGVAKPIGVSERYPIIKGVTRAGKCLNLFGCDSNGFSFSAPGFPSEKFIADYAFEEANHSSKSSPSTRFHKAFVQFTYLPDWVGFSGIQEDFFFDNETKLLDKLEVTYKSPDKIVADLGQAKISTAEGYAYSNRNKLTQGISLKSTMSLEIEVVEEIYFEEWINQFINPLQDFLTLATRRSNAVTKLSLYTNQNQIQSADGTLRDFATTVYYRKPAARNLKTLKTIDIRNMLFGFQDISVELEQILKTWLSKRDEYRSTMDLFFAIEYSSGTSLNNEFLNLSQALEVYHRQRFNSTVVPESEYGEKKRRIIEGVPKEHRAWLAEQLAHSNQPRLFQRLLELLKHTEKVVSKLITNSGDFSRKVTDTRNFLTHYSRRSKNVMDGEELFRATQCLSYIIQACLMLELGLSEERIVKLFERNQTFLFTAFQIKQAHYWE